MCQFVEDKGEVVFFRNANGLGEQSHFTNVRRVEACNNAKVQQDES